MHRAARQTVILQTLSTNGSCTVSELMRALNVSDETVRRDIKAMANKGLVERVHGGVILPHLMREPAFQKRLDQNAEAKRAIARLAATQVRDGDSLMMDTGSTTAYVARALSDHHDLFLVTNCVEIARTVANGNKGSRVYVAGGELRADDGATFGVTALDFVRRFRTRYAIVSIGAIHLDGGLMDYHLPEAEFCQAVIAHAAHVIVVADHSKFENQAPVKVCDFQQIGTLITDKAPPEGIRRRLQDAEVRLLSAE